jgi:hypothetical protein
VEGVEMKYIMIKVIAIYQIIIWSYAVFLFTELTVKCFLAALPLIIIFSQLVVVAFSSFFIYTNICFLFNLKKKFFSKFLNVNIWTNFFQIFNISIMGFTYYVTIGIHFFLFFSYDNNDWDILLSHSFFYEASYGVKFFNSTLIMAGVNLIPLLIFILLERLKAKSNKSKHQIMA